MNSENDYQSMASFSEKWRWDSSHSTITPPELEKISPLSPARGEEVWKRSLQFINHSSNDFRPSPILFSSIVEINVADKEKEEVQRWLAAQVKHEEEEIFVCWKFLGGAVITGWEIFLKFWDDFCYPASDDVSIWPKSEKWLLHYWHEEAFYFAT